MCVPHNLDVRGTLMAGLFGNASSAPVKRRVFVSYHHGLDQAYYDAFSRVFGNDLAVFSDRSLDRARDSDNPDYIMRYIRENHLAGASTLIVLCGTQTPYRKFVDWEIRAGLAQQMALIGVKLPSVEVINNGCSKPARLQDNIDSGYAKWIWWQDLTSSVDNAKTAIDDANHSRKNIIKNDRQRRLRNG